MGRPADNIRDLRVSVMNKIFGLAIFAAAALGVAISASAPAQAQGGGTLLEGKAAFTDWHADRPGLVRHIKPADMPAANLAGSSSNGVRIVRRTANDKTAGPPGLNGSPCPQGLAQ